MWLRPHKGERVPTRDGGRTDGHTSCGAIAEKDVYGTKLHESRRLQGDVNPRPFIYEFDVRQMVADGTTMAYCSATAHSSGMPLSLRGHTKPAAFVKEPEAETPFSHSKVQYDPDFDVARHLTLLRRKQPSNMWR